MAYDAAKTRRIAIARAVGREFSMASKARKRDIAGAGQLLGYGGTFNRAKKQADNRFALAKKKAVSTLKNAGI